jgi:hypothetical protein
MLGVLQWIAGLFRALAGLILPVFQKAKGPRRLGPVLRAVLHILILLLILGGLYALNTLDAVREVLPLTIQFLRPIYLPIGFLLVYALWWLGYWLWKLLVTEEEGPQFPDIDKAWEEAKDALREAGLGLGDLPLVLILGRPWDGEGTLFKAAQVELKVKGAPSRDDAPLRLFAAEDSLYLTCAGASLTGLFSQSLYGKLPGAPQDSTGGADDEDGFMKTIMPGARGPIGNPARVANNIRQIIQQAEREGRAANQLTKAEKRVLFALNRQNNPERSPLRNHDLVMQQTARLRYLCRLVVRDRHPYCAVNGVLLLVPFAATDSNQDAAYGGEVLYQDLKVTAEALQVDCTHVALVCDMETAPGFADLLQHFSDRQRLQPLGLGCPLAPDFRRAGGRDANANTDPALPMAASLADWICNAVVPAWVYQYFAVEAEEADDAWALVRGNSRLFQLTDELRERASRLGAILSRGLEARSGRSAKKRFLFGGCYLAGTGENAAAEQAFVRGVLVARLVARQEFVYWTEQVKAEEAACQWWLTVGWAGLGLVVLAVVIVVLIRIFNPF